MSQDSKMCSACKKVKPLTEFSGRKSSPDGLSYKCKQCERDYTKRNYKGRMSKPGAKNYYQLHKKEQLLKSKDYYETNKDRLLELNRKYREEHPEVSRKAGKKRRKQLREQKTGSYSRYEIMKRDSVDGMVMCQICKKPICNLKTGIGEEDLNIDHIVPVTKGGEDSKKNVRCTHKKCNIKRPRDGKDERWKTKQKGLPTTAPR